MLPCTEACICGAGDECKNPHKKETVDEFAVGPSDAEDESSSDET